MHINVTKTKQGKLLSAAALALMVAGCATNGQFNGASGNNIPASQWLNTSGTVTFFSSGHSQRIDNASVGEVVALGKTPWGSSTRVKVESSYFSATGKTCFATTIETSSRRVPSTLCKYPEGEWGATRATILGDSGPKNSSTGGLQ